MLFSDTALLQPLLVFLLLGMATGTRLGWLRVRDFRAQRLHPQKYAVRTGRASLSPAAERTSDHYENLFEMPVLFMAAVFAIMLAGESDRLYLFLAWTYVALRVIHSIIHLTYNRVYHRFLVFLSSACVLAVIIVRLAYQVLIQG